MKFVLPYLYASNPLNRLLRGDLLKSHKAITTIEQQVRNLGGNGNQWNMGNQQAGDWGSNTGPMDSSQGHGANEAENYEQGYASGAANYNQGYGQGSENYNQGYGHMESNNAQENFNQGYGNTSEAFNQESVASGPETTASAEVNSGGNETMAYNQGYGQ